ncbi:hypothetical protein ACFV1L_23340 [Kitasatospora sp. NPDC059646]|uniref:hypothetical protein n=1 Tax=Kitasatospora sp. NPDC059646 TaxID=3346893 RepID=UPI00367F46CE
MEETPQGGAGGVPTPERDREEHRDPHQDDPLRVRLDYRDEGRPPTVRHGPASDRETAGDEPAHAREDHRAEGRPPTVTHDW